MRRAWDVLTELWFHLTLGRVREPSVPVRPAVPHPYLTGMVPPIRRRWGAAAPWVMDGQVTVVIECECCPMNDRLAATRYLEYAGLYGEAAV